MKYIILLLSTLFLMGCGLELDQPDSEKYKAENERKLVSDYSEVQGLYTGEMTSNRGKTFPVELKLIVFKSSSGTGADGKPVPVIKLKGRVRRTDIVQAIDYMDFESDYNKATQQIKMSFLATGAETPFGQPESTSLEGTFDQGMINAKVYVTNGLLGHVKVKRISETVIGKSLQEEINEFHNRLIVMYSKFVGTYESCMKSGSGKRLYPLALYVSIGYKKDRPYLRTVVQRTDYKPAIDFDIDTNFSPIDNSVTFEPPANPVQGRSAAYLFGTGYFKSNQLVVNQFSDKSGLIGNGKFRASKNKRLKSGYCKKK